MVELISRAGGLNNQTVADAGAEADLGILFDVAARTSKSLLTGCQILNSLSD